MLRPKTKTKTTRVSSKASKGNVSSSYKTSPLLSSLSSIGSTRAGFGTRLSSPTLIRTQTFSTKSRPIQSAPPSNLLTLTKDQIAEAYESLPKTKKDFFLRMPTTDFPYSMKLDYHYVIMPKDIDTLDRQIKTLNRLPPPIPELTAPDTLITRNMQIGDDILDAEMEIELETYQSLSDHKQQKAMNRREEKRLRAEEKQRKHQQKTEKALLLERAKKTEQQEVKLRKEKSKYYGILPPPPLVK